jgi:hypothetical protein
MTTRRDFVLGGLTTGLAIAAEPAVQKRFMDAGAKLVGTSAAKTQAFAASERVKWTEAVEISGAKLD